MQDKDQEVVEAEWGTLENLAGVVQALILAAPEPISLMKLKSVLGYQALDKKLIEQAIAKCNESFAASGVAFSIVEAANCYCFKILPKYDSWVKKLMPEKQDKKLSPATLETLAIIAYKQPITKVEIDDIRGVKSSDGPLKNLLERRLIDLGGRSDKVGNPYYYITTKEFLRYFEINNLQKDLPRLDELDDVVGAGNLVPQVRGEQVVVPNQDDFEQD